MDTTSRVKAESKSKVSEGYVPRIWRFYQSCTSGESVLCKRNCDALVLNYFHTLYHTATIFSHIRRSLAHLIEARTSSYPLEEQVVTVLVEVILELFELSGNQSDSQINHGESQTVRRSEKVPERLLSFSLPVPRGVLQVTLGIDELPSVDVLEETGDGSR
jgi:hypothetical protein